MLKQTNKLAATKQGELLGISIEIAITNVGVVIFINFWPQWRNLRSSRLLFFCCSSLEHFLSNYCDYSLYFHSTLENSFNLGESFLPLVLLIDLTTMAASLWLVMLFVFVDYVCSFS